MRALGLTSLIRGLRSKTTAWRKMSHRELGMDGSRRNTGADKEESAQVT